MLFQSDCMLNMVSNKFVYQSGWKLNDVCCNVAKRRIEKKRGTKVHTLLVCLVFEQLTGLRGRRAFYFKLVFLHNVHTIKCVQSRTLHRLCL